MMAELSTAAKNEVETWGEVCRSTCDEDDREMKIEELFSSIYTRHVAETWRDLQARRRDQ